MRIAIVGSRQYGNLEFVHQYVERISIKYPDAVIVSGGAAGVDRTAVRAATTHGLEWKEYHPDWNRYGKSAGYKRNVEIITDSDICVAFWDGHSKGTQHSINIAKEQGKRVFIYSEDGQFTAE